MVLHRDVGVDVKLLLRRKRGYATADVAGHVLHLLERGQLRAFCTGCCGQPLGVKLRIAGYHGEDMGALIQAAEQCLEDLLRRHADLSSDILRGHRVWIEVILAQFVADTNGVEKADCIGLHAAFARRTVPRCMYITDAAEGVTRSD